MKLFRHHNADSITRDGAMNDNETLLAMLKIAVAWIAASIAKASAVVCGLTLSQWVQVSALLFTLAQLYFLLRDKWWRDPKRKRPSRRAQYDRSNT